MTQVIGKIAGCDDCSLREEDYNKDVQALARKHAWKHNHMTWTEITRVKHYDRRIKGEKQNG